MVQGEIDVLHEDNHCIAVLKPPRMLTAGDQTEDRSLLDAVRDYLKRKYRKPGNVFVGLVHRLDRPVSGIVLFARTSKGAARLSEQFREGSVIKTYRAVVDGGFGESQGEFVDWLLKDEATNIVRAVPASHAHARESHLRFRVVKSGGGLSLLEIIPQTGRSHQIRVQLSVRGHPLCGDRKYGSQRALGGAIALHAAELTFDHPTRHEPITVTAPLPQSWVRWFPEVCRPHAARRRRH